MTSHAAPSAVAGTGRDAAVAWHHGDPLREQRIADTRAAVVDRSHREVITVGGPDRLAWLHSICSQHVSDLGEGDSTEALVLSPNGHVEQHWQVTELGGVTWLDTEPGAGAGSLEYLNKMIFLRRVEPVDVTADWAVLSLLGPRTPDVLAAAGLPVPAAAGQALPLADGGFVRRASGPSADAADLIVPRAERDHVITALAAAGAAPAGLWAYEALRVADRIPRAGAETDHRTIPHEVGWIGRAVHLQKGCYRGQETVARVQNLGKPPRRLVLLHLAGESDELPAPGTPVELDGRTVGFVGTALHHYELGPIALSVIKRTIPDESLLTVTDHLARVES